MTDLINHHFSCTPKCADRCESSGLPGDTSAVSQRLHVWFTQALVQGSAPPHSSYCLSEILSPFPPSLWKCGNTGFSLKLIFGSNSHSPALAAPSYLWVAVHHLITGISSREFSKLGLFFVWWLFLSSSKFSLGFIYDWVILGAGPWHMPLGARKDCCLQEPCSGVGEQQGQQGILVPGIAMKGTFNVTLWGLQGCLPCLPSLLLAMTFFSSRIFQA